MASQSDYRRVFAQWLHISKRCQLHKNLKSPSKKSAVSWSHKPCLTIINFITRTRPIDYFIICLGLFCYRVLPWYICLYPHVPTWIKSCTITSPFNIFQWALSPQDFCCSCFANNVMLSSNIHWQYINQWYIYIINYYFYIIEITKKK